MTDFNLNYLRVFSSVYRRQSMTEAANDLHLTQSGVSQHMRNLEAELGVKLFDRIHRQLIPLPAADALYAKCERLFSDLEETLNEIRPSSSSQLKGSVRIGLPLEFGTNVILPIIADFTKEHRQLKVEVEFGLAAEVGQKILNGTLDLALMDHLWVDPRIAIESVYTETLHLCIHPELQKQFGAVRSEAKYFQKLPYVDYEKGETVLQMWFAHHIGQKRLKLNTRIVAENVQGVAGLITAGVGAGILPNHAIEQLRSQGHELAKYRGCGKPLQNPISIGHLAERSFRLAVQETRGYILQRLRAGEVREVRVTSS